MDDWRRVMRVHGPPPVDRPLGPLAAAAANPRPFVHRVSSVLMLAGAAAAEGLTRRAVVGRPREARNFSQFMFWGRDVSRTPRLQLSTVRHPLRTHPQVERRPPRVPARGAFCAVGQSMNRPVAGPADALAGGGRPALLRF